MRPINNWYYGGGVKQRTNLAQDGEGQFTIEKEKVKKTMANSALTAHIISETTKDKSTLTYVNNSTLLS